MSLRSTLEEAAVALDVVVAVGASGSVEIQVDGRAVALVDGADAAEFRLDHAVAAAACRTPDTGPGDRGRDWVRFTPATLDEHAVDRAVAWLGSAVRRERGG